ncbi:hypothetical protein BDV36DRAFT_134187 [Aspergillus pseudocaelatus]|uniref:Uncharacterized protein n=1 Tax=Aspergillus pseudocaelatus TaxID=1825620 RepID=A0ABQ6WSG9_9EURO|nr:hypothetical protein BDV36DRAFT_134187 [Aspergillus pseudocaelatus]
MRPFGRSCSIHTRLLRLTQVAGKTALYLRPLEMGMFHVWSCRLAWTRGMLMGRRMPAEQCYAMVHCTDYFSCCYAHLIYTLSLPRTRTLQHDNPLCKWVIYQMDQNYSLRYLVEHH